MRTLLVQLGEYNVDYEWNIKEEELRRLLIEEFCEYYDINDYFKGESLINDYMLFGQVEKDFLDNVISNNIWELTNRFENSLTAEIFKLLRTNKQMSLIEIEKVLRRTKKYETLILDSRSDVFLMLEEMAEFNGYELIEENETYTLKEAE
jgi:hypothetical protein